MPSHLPALAGVVKVLATCKEHQTIFVRGRRLPPHRRPLPVAFFQSNRQKQMGRAGCGRLPTLWVATRALPMVCGPLGPRGAGVLRHRVFGYQSAVKVGWPGVPTIPENTMKLTRSHRQQLWGTPEACQLIAAQMPADQTRARRQTCRAASLSRHAAGRWFAAIDRPRQQLRLAVQQLLELSIFCRSRKTA